MEYHVRRQDRVITDPNRIERLLRNGRFTTLALADGDEPYVVTLSYGYDPVGHRLYFHVAHDGMKLEMIGRNPRACATIFAPGEYQQGECAHPYESLILRGKMRVVGDASEKRHALRTLVEHLEAEPERFWASRDLDDADHTRGFTALCLEIEHITGKAGS